MSRSTRTEEVVTNPQLRALVDLARAQRAPELRVTIEDVWRRGEAQRQQRGRGWIVAGVVAMAAGLAAWIAMSPGDVAPVEDEVAPAQAQKVVEAPSDSGIASEKQVAPAPTNDGVVQDEIVTPSEDPEPQLALAEGVVFEPLGDAAPATILSSWRVEVAAGRYRVETPVGGSVLEIVVGPRVTRIEPGSKLTFDASRIDDADKDTNEPTAAALAQEAEQAMAQGRHADAIKALTKLVRRHPHSPQARAGLVDLARLHKSEGAWDRARCAYQLYLDRFPSASLRPEVERALYKLGEGKECNGLAPK